MKGLTWKKIMSLVLVAALVIGCLQLNAKKVSAGSVEESVGVIPGDQGRNPSGQYKLTGLDDITSTTQWNDTDVVLVVDVSSSMEGQRLAQVKAAATNFVKELLKDDEGKISIGIVSYGTKAKVVSDLTKSINTLNTKINGETTSGCGGESVSGGLQIDTNNGLTNIQAGIAAAEGLFKNNNHERVIVILSDGEPTIATDANGRQVVNSPNGYYCYYSEEIGLLTKAEADKAKNSGIVIYSILFGENSATAQKVMRDYVGSKDKYYLSSANADAINSVYTTIAQSIDEEHVAGVKSAYIVAQLADYIEYDAAATNNTSIEAVEGGIKWNIGELGDTELKSPSIKFKVTATAEQLIAAGFEKTTNAAGQTVIKVPVTAKTDLYYTTKDGTHGPIDVDKFITADFIIGQDIIPYTINYYIDGSETATKTVTGNAYPNDKVTAATLTANDFADIADYDLATESLEFTVTATTNVFSVNYTKKVDKINFVAVVVNEDGTPKMEDGKLVYDKVCEEQKLTRGTAKEDIVIPTNIPSYTVAATGTEVVSGAGVEYETTATYSFTGWDPQVSDVNGNVTYVAQYNGEVFRPSQTVKFIVVDDEGNEIEWDTQSGVPGVTPVTLPANPTKDPVVVDEVVTTRFRFDGWAAFKNGQDAVTVVDKIPETETKYYAILTPVTEEYTITYVYGTESYSQKVPYGTNTEAIKPVADENAKAYVDGLKTEYLVYSVVDEDGNVKWDKEVTVVKGDVTVTAIITSAARKYTVRIIDGNDVDVQTVEAGKNAILPVFEKEGFRFDGLTLEDGKDATEKLAKVLDNIDAYVNWIATAKLTFYSNVFGTESNPVYQTVEYTEKTTKAEFAALKQDPSGLANAANFIEWRTYPLVAVEDMNTSAARGFDEGYFTFDEVADILYQYAEQGVEVFDIAFYPYFKPATQPTPDPDPDPVVTQFIILPPVVTETPEEPTATPTEVPATPTPVEEEPIVVEEPETPEGDVEIDEIETPEGAPEEEELDVEPIDTPQGDLPKTGVAPSAVFFGIGAACVVFGGAIVLKLRRKEEM